MNPGGIPALLRILAGVPAPVSEVPEEHHPHAVENGVIRHLSVSQVKDAVNCERIWFLSKVRHLEKKKTKSQQIGIEGHKQLEHYLKAGQDCLGPIAAAGKKYLPEPNAGGFASPPTLLVEASLEDPPLTAAGLPFEGYIDIVNPRRLATEGVLRLTDHKFTKDIEKWAAKPEHLISTQHEHGIQMIGYARWAFLSGLFPGLKWFELEHIYYQTEGEKKAVSILAKDAQGRTLIPAQAFDAEWKRVEDMAVRLKVLARAGSLAEVKPTWSSCESYGGCSFRVQCLTFKETKPMASLLDTLRNGTTGKPAVPPPPPAAQTFAPPPARPKITIEDVPASAPTTLVAKFAKQGQKYTLPDGAVGEFVCATAFSGKTYYAFAVHAEQPPAQLHESAVITPYVEAPAAPSIEAAVTQAVEAKPDTVTATPPPAPAAEEKPKRTRRTKAEMEAARAAEAPIGNTAPPTTPNQTPAASVQPAEIPSGIAGALRVFIDAVPNEPTEPLAGYLGGIIGQIEKAFGVDDIRCAPNKREVNGRWEDHPLAFGKWKGVLAGCIKAEPPKPGTYAALGAAGSEILQVASEVLEGICGKGNFVRGVR